MKGDKSSDRESPSFWERELQACVKRLNPAMTNFVRFARWYEGNVTDLIDPNAAPNLNRTFEQSLDNMTSLVTDTAIADMFFRAPRFTVRCPFGQERGVFTPGLAAAETALLADQVKQTRYFHRARRRLLDARLGPLGVLKITYDRDIAVNSDDIDEARIEAGAENKALMIRGPGTTKNPTLDARENQLHSVHIDQHKQLLAEMERGVVPSTKALRKYLRKHIELHEAMRHSERPTETIRDASLVIRRVNPLEFFYDVTVDDISDIRWCAHTYLARKIDVMNRDDYDKEARNAVAEAQDRWVRQNIAFPGVVPTTGSFDTSDAMVRVYEVIDLVDGVVREYADGGAKMLREKPYTMKTIQPSGPYSILMFKPSVFEACGVPPPTAWSAEQAAVTALASAHTAAAIEGCRARGFYNSSVIDSKQVEEARQAPTGAWVPVQVSPDVDIGKAFASVPEVAPSEHALMARGQMIASIMQRSSLGSQKLLGGDRSDSATEAAIVAGASDSLSEDQAAIVDEASAFDAQMMVRVMRKTYPKAKVAEIVGQKLGSWWPEDGTWADADIVNDRGVDVVPGSSRRRNTAVDAKLMLEFLTVASSSPAMQGPAGQGVLIEAFRRYAEDQGISGLDWESVQAEYAATQAMGGMPGGAPGAGGGEGEPTEEAEDGGEQRESEMTEPSSASLLQGAANIGGGRLSTGASRGDRTRLLRGVG